MWLALDDPSHLLGSSATDCARCHHLSILPVLGYLCPYGVCHYIIFAHGLGIFPSQSLFLLFSNFNFDVVLRTTGLDLSALQRMYPRRNIENSNCLPKSNLNQLFHSFNSLDTLLRSSALTFERPITPFLGFWPPTCGISKSKSAFILDKRGEWRCWFYSPMTNFESIMPYMPK